MSAADEVLGREKHLHVSVTVFYCTHQREKSDDAKPYVSDYAFNFALLQYY